MNLAVFFRVEPAKIITTTHKDGALRLAVAQRNFV